MKKFFLMLVLLISSLTMFSQTTDYDYYKNYYRNAGWNIGLEQYGTATQGSTVYSYVNFYSGYNYKVIAMSNDRDVTDVDIYIYQSDGTLFTKDADASRLAIVTFSCSLSQQVKIVVKNYASRTPNYASTLRFFVAYY